nr:acyl-CoA thioester hydrolase/BAAT C-terminal domain-containing protein [Alicyclobacillus macrosporangiidus]
MSFRNEYVHLDYPHAGHVIRFPGVPTTQLRTNGGTPGANNATGGLERCREEKG